jgi:hypothetical protein
MPGATPSMRAGYRIDRGNTIVVELNPQAGDVCRALNLIHGRAWTEVPATPPEGARAYCYPTVNGFRFEDRD